MFVNKRNPRRSAMGGEKTERWFMMAKLFCLESVMPPQGLLICPVGERVFLRSEGLVYNPFGSLSRGRGFAPKNRFCYNAVTMKILAIESSCDETAAAMLEVVDGRRLLKTSVVSSQVAIHARYGGVVPEVAARNHVQHILPVVIDACLGEKPDYIAVTSGPGLITSLLVGVETAKTLSYLWHVPLVSVNHLEGHIYANWLDSNSSFQFPILTLIVSGGHTELVLMKQDGEYGVVGQTVDDAAGEAFDKVAKMLALGYPGGPIVHQRAERGNGITFNLPRPMKNQGLDFSFSGLKTAVRYVIRDYTKELTPEQHEQFTNDLCASFQQAVIDVLIEKTIMAAKQFDVSTILFGGGVMANTQLRAQLARSLTATLPSVAFHLPSLEVCTDNAAMIASASYVRIQEGAFTRWDQIEADPNWEI